jgi:hypothetical protein
MICKAKLGAGEWFGLMEIAQIHTVGDNFDMTLYIELTQDFCHACGGRYYQVHRFAKIRQISLQKAVTDLV